MATGNRVWDFSFFFGNWQPALRFSFFSLAIWTWWTEKRTFFPTPSRTPLAHVATAFLWPEPCWVRLPWIPYYRLYARCCGKNTGVVADGPAAPGQTTRGLKVANHIRTRGLKGNICVGPSVWECLGVLPRNWSDRTTIPLSLGELCQHPLYANYRFQNSQPAYPLPPCTLYRLLP